MKSRAIIPLAVGLVVGVVAIRYTMNALKKAGADTTEYITAVVATVDIAASAEIKPEMLRAIKTPKTPLVPHDVHTTTEKVVSRVAQKSIPQGSIVAESMLAAPGTLPGVTARVPAGYRAQAVRIDESSGVGYLVRPNDWVDVLVVMDVRRDGKMDTVSRVILQNVQVAAVGQILGDTQEDGGKHAKSVTLVVREEDSPKLHLAQSRGRITLVMRGSEDRTVSAPSEASESEVLGDPKEKEKKDDAPDAGMLARMMNSMKDPSGGVAPPQVAHQPFTVMVINGSAGNENDSKVQQIQYADDKSMDVLEIREGFGGSAVNRRRRPGGWPSTLEQNRAVEQESDVEEESEEEIHE